MQKSAPPQHGITDPRIQAKRDAAATVRPAAAPAVDATDQMHGGVDYPSAMLAGEAAEVFVVRSNLTPAGTGPASAPWSPLVPRERSARQCPFDRQPIRIPR